VAKSLIRAAAKAVTGTGHNIPFASKWNTNGGLYGSGTSDRYTQLNAMGMQGTLFAIVQLLSTGSHVTGDWQMFRKPTDGRVKYAGPDTSVDQRKEVLQHQALSLWNRPNDFMTGSDFREIGWQHMELAGEWYWVLNRGPNGNGIPIEMWPVRPDRMEPVPDPQKFLSGWVYTGPNGEQVPLSVGEVIQLKYPNPLDPYRGMSAVQALMADIDAARYTSEWTRNFFLNSAQPGGIVTFNKRLTDDEFTEFTSRWREQHAGVARGHRVGVLEQGAVWQANNWTVKDMDMTALRELTSDMIRQGYRIHQAMLGNSADVNRANAETAEEIHVAWQEIPRLNRQRNVLNTMYLEKFGATGTNVEMDYADPTPASANDVMEELTIKSQAAAVLVEAGWVPADVLKMVGIPAMGFKAPAVPTPAPAPGAPKPAQIQNPQAEQPDKPKAAPAADAKPTNSLEGPYLADFNIDLGTMLQEAFQIAKANGHGKEELV
jgi:HK97 family phage portal protein